MSIGTSPPGWYLDPTGQGLSRYWNGIYWTQAVDRGDMVLNIAIDPVLAQVPPGPGTQVTAPVVRQPAPSRAPQPAPVSAPDSSVMGVIFGVLAAFFLILMVVAIVNSNSADETPTIDVSVPVTTVAPAPETTAAPVPTDTAGG